MRQRQSTPKDYTSGYTQLGKLPELESMVLNKCYKPRRKIDLLLVSIGGNDVGFSSLVANAIMQDKSLLKESWWLAWQCIWCGGSQKSSWRS